MNIWDTSFTFAEFETKVFMSPSGYVLTMTFITQEASA